MIEIIILSVLIVTFCAVFVYFNYFNNTDKISFKESIDLTNLPVITLKQGNNKVNFLLDTGSTDSTINAGILNRLDYKKTEHLGNMFGFDGKSVETTYVEMDFYYNKMQYKELFQVVDMSTAFNTIKEQSGVNIHGILGNSFFERYNYIIDFQKLIAYGKNKIKL